MSLRNKGSKKRQFNEKELAALRVLNIKKEHLACQGMSPEHVKRMLAAEQAVFATKSTNKVNKGDKVSDGFKKISDRDPSGGIVIHNPITETNEAILGGDMMYNMDGTVHPATERYMKRNNL